MYKPKSDLENEMYKIHWASKIQTDQLIPVRRADLVITNKKRNWRVVDFVVLADHRVKIKESENRDKYLDLGREQRKLWNMKVNDTFEKLGKRAGRVWNRLKTIQTTTLLKSVWILRRVLETREDFLTLRFQWKQQELTLVWRILKE